MNKLVIIGAGGHAKVIYNIAILSGYDDIVFLDDINPYKDFKYEIEGTTEKLFSKEYSENIDVFVAIGDIATRMKYSKLIKEKNYNQPILIHPSAIVDKSSTIGVGSVIMANVVVNADVVIGENCIINTSCVIEHDSTVEDYSHISPGSTICGNCLIGQSVWIGAGCTIINQINVCDNVIIGAGTTLIKNINEAGTYVGLPIRRLK